MLLLRNNDGGDGLVLARLRFEPPRLRLARGAPPFPLNQRREGLDDRRTRAELEGRVRARTDLPEETIGGMNTVVAVDLMASASDRSSVQTIHEGQIGYADAS